MRVFRLWGILVLVACLTGCNQVDKVIENLGLVDQPASLPVRVVILLDTSHGSSCTTKGFHETLEVVLDQVADHPSSVVEVWQLGRDVATTQLLGTRSVASGGTSTGTRRATKARFLAGATEYLVKTAEPAFSGPPKDRSPIAEGIARVALNDRSSDTPSVIIVLTDAREFSQFGDWECGRLPEENDYVQTLHKEGVLKPASLAGDAVVFVDVTLGPVPDRGCPVTIERAGQIESLWIAALTAAGARVVEFHYGQAILTSSLFDVPDEGGDR
jgi:hypothetical protein